MKRLLVAAALLTVACTSTGAGGGAGGGDETSSTTTAAVTSGSSSSASMTPTADCPSLTTQAECESSGCIFRQATLFPSVGGAAPTCEGGTPVSVCTFYVSTPYQSVATFRRDVPAGRIAMVTPVLGANDVMGFEYCMTGSDDLCTCF